MSMTFTKLFSSITESTIWCEDDHTRLVWITMLAMADKRGRVWGSMPGLANRARVPLASCEAALNKLMSPDKYSRTEIMGGRRIEKMDGGWKLINYEKYRAIRDVEERRAYKTEKEREYRAARGQSGQKWTAVDPNGHNAEAEAEAYAEAENTNTLASTREIVSQPYGSMPMLGGKNFYFTERDVEQWRESFPGIDVLQQLREARQWLIDNPKLRKKNVRRFINSWLSREQDKAGRPNGYIQPTTATQRTLDAAGQYLQSLRDRQSSGGAGDQETGGGEQGNVLRLR